MATTKSKQAKLRFAAFIRVSTEQQEKRGESLDVQKEGIEKAVEELDGTIAEWYGGQEHATPGHEKKEIDRLLSDAKKRSKPFNAFIVYHADRWSRDNTKSAEGLEVFRKHKIKFFIGTSEQDLHNPDNVLYLDLSAVIGKYFALNQKRKARASKVKKAKRGIPVCGRLPFGRTFDKESETWGVDKEKQEFVVDTAERYLKGESLADIAKERGINDHSRLHRILTSRCGDTWEQRFKTDDGESVEVITTAVPPLLSQKTINAIHKRAAANKTYTHGEYKNRYLLSSLIFCEHCGNPLFGQTCGGKWQYYRHLGEKRVGKCSRPAGAKYVNVNEIETVVMAHLFETFGNPKRVQQAIKDATPNHEEFNKAQKNIERINKELAKITKSRARIKRQQHEELIPEAEGDEDLKKLRDREIRLTEKKNRLHDTLSNLPDAKQIAEVSECVAKRFKNKKKTRKRLSAKRMLEVMDTNHDYEGLTWDEKRYLLETVFGGKMPDGDRMGIWIAWDDKNKWRFSIKGHLINLELIYPHKNIFDLEQGGGGAQQDQLLTRCSSYLPKQSSLKYYFTIFSRKGATYGPKRADQ